MAKITRHGGPSDKYEDGPIQHILRRRPVMGVKKSRGNSSKTSSVNDKTKSNDETQSPPQPAPTTENPSVQPQTEQDSSASSTDGDTHKTETPRSGKKAVPAKKANLRAVNDDEFDEPVDFH